MKMKLILPVVVVLAMALFYLHVVANRYSPHTKGAAPTYLANSNEAAK